MSEGLSLGSPTVMDFGLTGDGQWQCNDEVRGKREHKADGIREAWLPYSD